MQHRPHTYWMDRCLELARKSVGAVSPNPLVGAVIIRNGRCIGRGYHRRFGEAHAEVEAVRDAESRCHDVAGADIYVNLEPCSHHGKTPPCADLLIAKGFRRVVVAMADPNPLVAGRGLRRLRAAGIRCTVGIRKKEALALNRAFITSITTGMPLVAVKAAQTSDGFIARTDGTSKWITGVASRRHAHRLRAEFDAVLVGARTVMIDDPALTVRSVPGRDPARVVIDGRCSVPVTSAVFTPGAPCFYFVDARFAAKDPLRMRILGRMGVRIIRMRGRNGELSIPELLRELWKYGIASVLVEGGNGMYQAFFNARSVHRLLLFTAPKKFHTGYKTFQGISVSFNRKLTNERHFGQDVYREYDIRFRR